MSAPTQFRHSWVAPNWMHAPTITRLLYTLTKPLDWLTQFAIEGVHAAFPGYGTPTALPVLGQSRGLLQGETETNAHFAARLIAWFATWSNAGDDGLLAQEIQQYLGDTPKVRVINRAGYFVTANPDGTVSYASDPTWNWDRTSNPGRTSSQMFIPGDAGGPTVTPWWSDIWIVVYPAEWATYAGFADAAWLANWGNPAGGGIDHNVPRVAVDAILGLVAQWKGAHTYVQAIVWCTDPTLFVPGSLSTAGNPDGTWGELSKNANGVQVPARTTVTSGGTVAYWTPTGGV